MTRTQFTIMLDDVLNEFDCKIEYEIANAYGIKVIKEEE